MALKIYLIRHGQDEDNKAGILNGHRDTPLSELGVSQAKNLANYVKQAGITFDTVYSSPLNRVFTTARTVTQELGLEDPTIWPDLIERNFGIMTGKLVKDIPLLCSPVLKTPQLVTYFLEEEGAETFPDLLARAQKIITQVKEQHQDGSILLATHGDLGKMLYAAYYGLDWKDVLIMFHFGNSELLLLSEDSKPEDVHVFSTEQFNH